MDKKAIDNLREVCGTLPNRDLQEISSIFYGNTMLEIELIDEPKNMYKAIFALATATWGNNTYQNKWRKVSPLERYIVVASALKGKTLPTALEAPKFTFQVRGTPRHCFDQMARSRIGSGFGSIGCRDNSKADASFILYSEYEKMNRGLKNYIFLHLEMAKATYMKIISQGGESWQVARSVLPMSYHHPFVFNQTLLALIGQSKRRLCFGEEEFICGIHWKIRDMFDHRGLRLISNALRPACDFAGKCLYSKSDGSELFSNLFAGCGRHLSDSEYAEWNKSCTDKKTLERQTGITIPGPEEYIDFTLDKSGFSKLGIGDLVLLDEV